MGIKLIYIHFERLSDQKLLNSSNVRDNYQKSLRSSVKDLYDVFNDMKEELFCCQKSYGNTTRMNFFYTKKKSVSASGIFGRTNQKCFQYDQRPSYIILWKEGNFYKSNSYGHKMVLSSIYRDFFVFVRID